MESSLFKLYEHNIVNFEKIISNHPDNSIAGPLLIATSELYLKEELKLLVIGQDTNGWGHDYLDPGLQMNLYKNFNVGEKYNSVFWSVVRKLEGQMGISKCSCLWTNINKFDVDSKRPKNEYEISISAIDSILVEEIRIIQPDVCVFFTGPDFDMRIKGIFKDIVFEKINDNEERTISRLSHRDLPFLTFKTYHPQYLRRSAIEDTILNIITTEIKK